MFILFSLLLFKAKICYTYNMICPANEYFTLTSSPKYIICRPTHTIVSVINP